MGNYMFISDAAKEVKVESHVLRYWEDELHLPIKRNELGHRYYTEEDVERFKQIKGMKERGLQLKAIKMILKDGKLDVLSTEDSAAETAQLQSQSNVTEREGGLSIDIVPNKERKQEVVQESREDKSRRLQWLLQQLIRQTLQENNRELCREIRDGVVKELDYQFRMQEEREEERDRMLAARDEEHYKKMDELLRKKSRRLRKEKEQKEKDKNRDKKAQSRENPDARDGSEARDARETRDSRDTREAKDTRIPKDVNNARGILEGQPASSDKKRRRFLL